MLELILRKYSKISTHAPLARCDRKPLTGNSTLQNFNSRTSCEVRRYAAEGRGAKAVFQLTHLLRGATFSTVCNAGHDGHFNSRTSCEVRPGT